ncbi:MAG: hypothetical protein VX498_04720 [Myxococcota bacterium]|nr:hypothetical protein [Myxococcota bacterium]
MGQSFGGGEQPGSEVRYFCGGPWGQQEGLSAEDVARLVATTAGPHYVWAPGFAEWTPAMQVQAIAQALQSLGGVTVEPDAPLEAAAVPKQRGGNRQRQVLLLISGLGGFLLFLLVAWLVFRPGQEPPPPPPAPPPPVTAEPSTPEPPPKPLIPRIDSVVDRPANWSSSPVTDARGQRGRGEASSELREAGGRRHSARNVGDVRNSTAWCEGDEGSDGRGQWVQLALPCAGREFRDLVGLEIVSGFGTKRSAWEQNNRLAQGKLTVTVDGLLVVQSDLFLKDHLGAQYLAFPRPFLCREGETARVRIEIEEVHLGTKYSDTCISTLALYERVR